MVAKVGVVMGSKSDWPIMSYTCEVLGALEVDFEKQIVSAHRTPDLLASYAREAQSRGIKVIIAGAGGSAHLPGMLAAQTTLPVLGVPIETKALGGMDSLLSIVQMPKGVPVGTLAIGKSGAINGALFAVSILALEDKALKDRWQQYRDHQTQTVLNHLDPEL